MFKNDVIKINDYFFNKLRKKSPSFRAGMNFAIRYQNLIKAGCDYYLRIIYFPPAKGKGAPPSERNYPIFMQFWETYCINPL